MISIGNNRCFLVSSKRLVHSFFLATFFLLFALLFSTQTAYAETTRTQISYVNVDRLSIRESEDLQSDAVLDLPRGEELIVEEWNENGQSLVRCGNHQGYVKSENIKKPIVVENFSPALMGTVNADGVNLRCKSEADAAIISVLKKGAPVEVLGITGNWFKVSSQSNVGYVHRDYVIIAEEDAGEAAKEYKVLKMGMSGKEVAYLQQALREEGVFGGEINGTFGARTRDAVSAYQSQNGWRSDGIADENMQKALFE